MLDTMRYGRNHNWAGGTQNSSRADGGVAWFFSPLVMTSTVVCKKNQMTYTYPARAALALI